MMFKYKYSNKYIKAYILFKAYIKFDHIKFNFHKPLITI